jgi:hypothetical protein
MQGSKNLLTNFFFGLFVYAIYIHSLGPCLRFQETSLKVATDFHMLVASLVCLCFCILYYLKISKTSAYNL